MKKKFTQVLAMMLMGSMALTGCGSSESESDEKVARLVSGSEPGSLHPALAQGTHESIILDHIFEGLMKRDADTNLVEGMAESYTISEDELTYTFTIREDAKWSNGDPVTARDFEVAWKYALNPDTAADYAYQLYYLKNGEAYNNGTATEDEVGVKALDDRTLEVVLERPTAYFLELCAFYTYYPVNSALQEEMGSDWANDGETYVGNGAFTLTEWNHDQSVELVKNDYYYNKDVVNLDGIEFYLLDDLNTMWQMYENEEIDIDFDLPTDVLGQLIAENNAELTNVSELATYYYRFNTTEKPFNNAKVRKALSMAIDRESIVNDVTQGGQIPAYALVCPQVVDGDGDFRENGGDYFEENIEEAKALLAEGLAEEGMDTLDFTILYNTSESHKKIAEAIQQMWNENLGVNVTLENTEMKVKLDRESKLDYQVSRSGWVGDYIDPNTFLDLFTSWSSQNDTGWTSAAYDELIQKASSEIDKAARMDYLHQAEELLMEEMPIMPIYYYTKGIMTKPYLTGVTKAVNRDISLIYADITK